MNRARTNTEGTDPIVWYLGTGRLTFGPRDFVENRVQSVQTFVLMNEEGIGIQLAGVREDIYGTLVAEVEDGKYSDGHMQEIPLGTGKLYLGGQYCVGIVSEAGQDNHQALSACLDKMVVLRFHEGGLRISKFAQALDAKTE